MVEPAATEEIMVNTTIINLETIKTNIKTLDAKGFSLARDNLYREVDEQ